MSWTVPPRKQPLPAHAKNTYKNTTKAANTYKKQPKPAASGMNRKFLWLALAGGCALALLTTTGGASPKATPGTTPAPTPGTGGSTPAPAPGTTPAPVPPVVVYRPPTTAPNYIFVDDFMVEGIFEKVRKESHWIDGFGYNRITNLKPKQFAGIATGKVVNGMMELWYKIGDQEYNYWIDAGKTRAFSKAGYDAYIAGAGFRMSKIEESAIINFFKNK